MCGRFAQYTTPDEIAELYQLGDVPALTPRYNIAPTESILALRVSPESGDREFAMLRWGLVPSWAKDPKIGNTMIIARSETVAVKPSFRTALTKRRCLIIADGFYEWQRNVKPSRPHYFAMKDRKPFAIAGLWERYQPPQGDTIQTCAILTTAANTLMASIHDRMPVILNPADHVLWLDLAMQDVGALARLYHPFPEEFMTTYPVSAIVNNPRNDHPQCVEPLAETSNHES